MTHSHEEIIQTLDIPEEELEEYRDAFKLFDKDGSGSISPNEFLKVLKNLGQNISKQEANDLIMELDSDGSGEIGFDEFISYMKKIKVDEDEPEEEDPVIKAFKTFDLDKNGSLSKEEFRHILCQLGSDKFSVDECDEIFKEADINKDAKLDYHEFVAFWRNV